MVYNIYEQTWKLKIHDNLDKKLFGTPKINVVFLKN